MPIIATAKSENGRDFAPAPAGVHQAVCVDVVDLGILDVTWQGVTKKQHKVNVAWQIAEDRDDGKPFLVFKRYTLSLHEKAGLRKDLEAWLGRKFGRDDEMGFDVESMVGRNCLLNITHNEVGEKVYANVVSIMPLAKGMPTMSPRDYVRKIDRTIDDAPVHREPQPPIELDDSDIPFAWLLPYLVPAMLAGGAVLA
jgi:hypothetical protein